MFQEKIKSKRKLVINSLLSAGACLLLAACSLNSQIAPTETQPAPTSELTATTEVLPEISTPTTVAPTTIPTVTTEANMPNPASVYCEEQGGTVEIRENEAGQYGVCVFPDGGECDEWAFFRGECQKTPLETPVETGARYVNANYGFTLNPSEEWTIDEFDDHLILQRGAYCLFAGYRPASQDQPIFRTGMPAGDFVDGGTFLWQGNPLPKKLLVFEDKTKLVYFCQQDQRGCLQAGDLSFFFWFETCQENIPDYQAIDIPAEEIAEAVKVVESLELLVREEPNKD